MVQSRSSNSNDKNDNDIGHMVPRVCFWREEGLQSCSGAFHDDWRPGLSANEFDQFVKMKSNKAKGDRKSEKLKISVNNIGSLICLIVKQKKSPLESITLQLLTILEKAVI